MATQREIAADIGLSEEAVSNALGALGLMKREWAALSVSDARKMLVRHYTELAAGRGGLDQFNLTAERARESRLKGDLLQLQIQEKAGTLIPADAVEREWGAMIVAARSELLLLPEKIAHAIKTLHDIDIDAALIESHVHDALHRLSAGDASDEDPA